MKKKYAKIKTKFIILTSETGWAQHTCTNCGRYEVTDWHVWLDWRFCPWCGKPIVNDYKNKKSRAN